MKKDLNFYWRMGDYALEACPARLVRFDEDEPNVTINLVKFYQYKGKEAMYSIGYFYYDEHEPSWGLKFVGDRFKDILEGDFEQSQNKKRKYSQYKFRSLRVLVRRWQVA